MRSEMMLEAYQVSEANWRDATKVQPHFAISETPRFVGRAIGRTCGRPGQGALERPVALERRAGEGLWVRRPRRLTPDCWRYMIEVQEAGKPADVTGYR